MLKKIIIPFVTILAFAALEGKSLLLTKGYCKSGDYFLCNLRIENSQDIQIFMAVVFVFSLVSLISNKSFIYWFKFAKFALVISSLVIIMINLEFLHGPVHGNFGWGSVINEAIDNIAFCVLYTVFTVGSIIQIYRGWRKS